MTKNGEVLIFFLQNFSLVFNAILIMCLYDVIVPLSHCALLSSPSSGPNRVKMGSAPWFDFVVLLFCELMTLIYLFLQLKGTKRTATTAGQPPAAAAERGKGGAETGTDAAGTAEGTVRSADTDAGLYLLYDTPRTKPDRTVSHHQIPIPAGSLLTLVSLACIYLITTSWSRITRLTHATTNNNFCCTNLNSENVALIIICTHFFKLGVACMLFCQINLVGFSWLN